MYAVLVVDPDQLAHRRELNLSRIARAVATQFPIINKGKINCGVHRIRRIELTRSSLESPSHTGMIAQRKLRGTRPDTDQQAETDGFF